ncbi:MULTISPECIES: NmrA family NAD(P)-binding protein [unclassified Roseovarius]|uniref:NmrA family NAD(P)-binding protein n=1 Tax=unclassified Roseovarius TaxID=2614913 RepID=UPI00273F17F4|nr:NmrA family NAD(P)-binding protein [Roseovarius sp. MMSF_3350]
MHIILGGTGQVGSATARALLDKGETVTVVTRNRDNGAELAGAGARVAEADIRDVAALRGILATGRRAFLLNPPADPAGDTDTEERRNVDAILSALQGSGLEKVVAASTYGAFRGHRCGDLTVLHAFETALASQPIPAAINRGGYYMSNWAGMADQVRQSGILPSFFPANLRLPMVAPGDLGKAAARRLMSSTEDIGIQHVEGPERYTAHDVAAAFAKVLGRKVKVEEIPPAALEETFRGFGFSDTAAASYACMTRRLIDGKTDTDERPSRGKTRLEDYVAASLA